MDRNQNKKLSAFKILTYLPVVFFALAALFILLPYVQILDPFSGNTKWLNIFQAYPDDWHGDEMQFSIDNPVFPLIAAITCVFIMFIPWGRHLGFCYTIQIILGLLGSLVLTEYYSYLNLDYVDQYYPVVTHSQTPFMTSGLLLIGSIVSIISWITWWIEEKSQITRKNE